MGRQSWYFPKNLSLKSLMFCDEHVWGLLFFIKFGFVFPPVPKMSKQWLRDVIRKHEMWSCEHMDLAGYSLDLNQGFVHSNVTQAWGLGLCPYITPLPKWPSWKGWAQLPLCSSLCVYGLLWSSDGLCFCQRLFELSVYMFYTQYSMWNTWCHLHCLKLSFITWNFTILGMNWVWGRLQKGEGVSILIVRNCKKSQWFWDKGKRRNLSLLYQMISIHFQQLTLNNRAMDWTTLVHSFKSVLTFIWICVMSKTKVKSHVFSTCLKRDSESPWTKAHTMLRSSWESFRPHWKK